MGKRILFKKIKLLNYLLTIFMASSMIFPSFSYAISGTINFTGIDFSETGSVVTDGQTGGVIASDIPGIDIDIFGSNDKINPVGKFIYLDFQNVITPSDVPTYTYNYIVIKSRDGSNFSFNSAYINNCNMMEDAVYVEGIRDGDSQGTVNLTLDAGGMPSQFNRLNGLTESIFQNVDQVIISSNTPGATDVTAGIGAIQIADPVMPTVALIADTTSNSVDNDLEITFASDAIFESAITGVSYNGNALTAGQYTVSNGKVTLKPSVAGNTYLRTPGTANVVISASGYGNSTVSQTIQAGAVETLEVTAQPVPGTSSGDVFSTQPIVKLKDQYGNYCMTGVSATANVVATAKSGTGSWSIGGTTTKSAVAGTATFSDLKCTLTTSGDGKVTFTSGVNTVDSSTFTIPQKSAKVLTADTISNSVDNDLEITFIPDATFEGAITGVSYDGNALTSSQYTVSSGKVTLKPSVSGNTYLRTPGTGNVVISASGYGNSTVSQTIQAGMVQSLEVTTQPVPGASSGDAFATQPIVKLKDQYGNYCTTGVSATANVVATTKSGTGSWSIGGTTTKSAVAGTATFSDLTCMLTTSGDGKVTFTSGVKTVDSSTFTIPQNGAKTLTADTTSNSVDNDLEITFAPDTTFEGAITGVSYDGNALASSQYTVSSGKVTLKPSIEENEYLRTPGTGNVVILASGYGNSTVSQTIQAGTVQSLEVTTQPVPGALSGDAFATQPIVKLKDQYGNYCTTGVSATANVVATAKSGTGSWSIGGTTTKSAVAGTATFSDLTCTLTTSGDGKMTFTSGVKTVDSSTFTIPQKSAKTLTADTTSNSVDNDLEITFVPDTTFEGAITGVSYDGNALTSSQYTVSSGKVTLKPSIEENEYLRTPGNANVVISASGYGNSTVSQTIQAGTVETLEVTTQPVPGALSGDAFATQPIVKLKDQYGNYCTTGVSATANVVATAKIGTGSWSIGGTTTKGAVAGTATFSDLTCTLTTSGDGKMTFTSGIKTVDSSTFTIPQKSAKTLTADTTSNSVDNDLEITFTPDATFESAITGISYNENTLDASQYTVSSGKVTLKPSVSGNTYLRTPGTANVVISASGYDNSTVSQTIEHGAVAKMVVDQNIITPANNGGEFAQQPIIMLKDAYDNICTSDSTTVVTAAKEDSGTWTLTGTTTATGGIATFTDLGATNATRVSNAQIGFTATGLAKVTSTTVTLPSTTPPSGSGGSGGSSTTAPTGSVNIVVNGETISAGTELHSTENGKSAVNVTVNNKVIQSKIDEAVRNNKTGVPMSRKWTVFLCDFLKSKPLNPLP